MVLYETHFFLVVVKMHRPFKVIHAFPGKSHRVRYRLYVFVGTVPKAVREALDVIQDLPLVEALTTLTRDQNKVLREAYGDVWWLYVYPSYHLRKELQELTEATRRRLASRHQKAFADQLAWPVHEDADDHDMSLELGHPKPTGASQQTGGAVTANIVYDDDADPDDSDDSDDSDDTGDAAGDAEGVDVVDETTMLADEERRTRGQLQKDRRLFATVLATEKAATAQGLGTHGSYDSRDDDDEDQTTKTATYRKTYVTSQFILASDTVHDLKEKVCAGLPYDEAVGVHLTPDKLYCWGTRWSCAASLRAAARNGCLVRPETCALARGSGASRRVRESVALGFEWTRGDERWAAFQDNFPKHVDDLLDTAGNSWLQEVLAELSQPLRRVKIVYQGDMLYASYGLNYNEVLVRDVYHDVLHLPRSAGADETWRTLRMSLFKLYYPRVHAAEVDDVRQPVAPDLRQEAALMHQDLTNRLVLASRPETLVRMAPAYAGVGGDVLLTQGSIRGSLPRPLTDTVARTLFNFFVVDAEYPAVAFHPKNRAAAMKVHDASLQATPNVFESWFNTAPYGLMFRIRVADTKFATVMIRGCQVECRLQWPLEERATMHVMESLADVVRRLERKLAKAPTPQPLSISRTFAYNFLHVSQPVRIPVDHNKLSHLARLFFPFLTLVIAPGKRGSSASAETRGKFGTYLRYRRVDNYQSQTEREQRVVALVRDYGLGGRRLVDEVANSFNLTEEQATTEIAAAKKRQPHVFGGQQMIRGRRDVLNYKSGGVAIEIQGKTQTNLKILGAKHPQQLRDILRTMHVLFGVYDHVYNRAAPRRIPAVLPVVRYDEVRDVWLTQLDKVVARRKDIVAAIMETRQARAEIKRRTSFDRDRLKGWARICQGVRQASPYLEDELVTRGFALDADRGVHVKPTRTHGPIEAVKLENQNHDAVYWACDNASNGDYVHVGFAKTTKKNQTACLPCCFKKKQSESATAHIRDKYRQCTGQQATTDAALRAVDAAKLEHILQKAFLVEGRLGVLPKYLHAFLNLSQKSRATLDKQNRLLSTTGEHCFSFGTRHRSTATASLVDTLGLLVGQSVAACAAALAAAARDPTTRMSLQQGAAYRRVGGDPGAITAANLARTLSWEEVLDLASTPGVLGKAPGDGDAGLNIFIFEMSASCDSVDALDKDAVQVTPYVPAFDRHADLHQDRPTALVLCDRRQDPPHFIPVVRTTKALGQPLVLRHLFPRSHPVVRLCLEFWGASGLRCLRDMGLPAYPLTRAVLPTADVVPVWLARTVRSPRIRAQVVDSYLKCAYLVLADGHGLLPVRRASVVPGLAMVPWGELDEHLVELTPQLRTLTDLASTVPQFAELHLLASDDGKVRTLRTAADLLVPVKASTPSAAQTRAHRSSGYEPRVADVDRSIAAANPAAAAPPPPRDSLRDNLRDSLRDVTAHLRQEENFYLFMFHFSFFMGARETQELVATLGSDATGNAKEEAVVRLLDGVARRAPTFWTDVRDQVRNAVENYRVLCSKARTAGTCDPSHHCCWVDGRCLIGVWKTRVDEYVRRLAGILISNAVLRDEFLRVDGAVMSNMVDPFRLTVHPGELMFQHSNPMFLRRKLAELARRRDRDRDHEADADPPTMPPRGQVPPVCDDPGTGASSGDATRTLVTVGRDKMLQRVAEDDLALFRAIANAAYWAAFAQQPTRQRNLGYASQIQDTLARYVRAKVADDVGWDQVTRATTPVAVVCGSAAALLGLRIIVSTQDAQRLVPVATYAGPRQSPTDPVIHVCELAPTAPGAPGGCFAAVYEAGTEAGRRV
jgi:hypothetical protein